MAGNVAGQISQGLTALVGGGDVEKYQFVSTGLTVLGPKLYRVAGIAEVDEVYRPLTVRPSLMSRQGIMRLASIDS